MKKFPFPLRFSIPAVLFFFGIFMGLFLYYDAVRFVPYGTILLVLSLFMSLYLYETITKRVNALVDATNRFAKGESSVRCKLKGSDELVKLSDAFNGMADKIEADTEALRKSEERFDLAMRGANDGLWDRDLTTNEIYFSPRWKQMLGHEDHEIPNKYEEWRKRVHQEDIHRVQEIVNAHLEGRTPHYKCEYRLRHKDGTYLWILSRGLAIRDAEGRPYRIAGSHTDITECIKTEDENLLLQAQMLQAQKLESLGVLAGGIAHDFNNLLMSIRGNSDLAVRNLPDSSPARQPIERISNIVQRATELTRQMLAYSGKGRFVIEDINISDFAGEMTELLRVSIGNNVTMECHLALDLPQVEADATQIRQVVMNLIINASDAVGEKNGTVTVSTGVMECDREYLCDAEIGKELPEGSYVYIEVKDTGCGMDAETKAKIFDPFFTTKFTGRGLGLAAVHGIIRGHKGGLKVISRVGEGTTFRVFLPKSDEHPGKHPEAQKDVKDFKRTGTILLIDDEEEIASVTKMMLEFNGFSVLTATDGQKGVELFSEHVHKINLVLMDLTMPKMNGEEAFREMKQIRDDVRVILVSGYNEEEIKNRFYGEGFAGFLQKPYGMPDLMDKIQEFLT